MHNADQYNYVHFYPFAILSYADHTPNYPLFSNALQLNSQCPFENFGNVRTTIDDIVVVHSSVNKLYVLNFAIPHLVSINNKFLVHMQVPLEYKYITMIGYTCTPANYNNINVT